MEADMRYLKLQTSLQQVMVPDDCPRGIYRYTITSCPGRMLQEFRETLINEGTLSPESPELPEIADAPINSKKRKASSKSINAKEKLTEKKNAKKITPSKSNEKSDKSKEPRANPELIRWRDMPLFNMDRSKLYNLTPRQYIETYWASHHSKRPQRYAYAYDKSLFNNEIKKLNLANLFNPLMQTYQATKMPGVNRPMVLISGSHTSFYWHNEDMELASINYMHWGAPKLWVIVHRSSTDKFLEALIRDFASTEITPCKNPVKHKNYLTDLQWLTDNEIEYSIVSSTYCTFFSYSQYELFYFNQLLGSTRSRNLHRCPPQHLP